MKTPNNQHKSQHGSLRSASDALLTLRTMIHTLWTGLPDPVPFVGLLLILVWSLLMTQQIVVWAQP